MQGLHTAVEQLFPNAEHRYCIRHIHDNMRKRWRQTEYRDHLWRCASATTIPEFEHLMKEFSQYDKEACEWLKQIPPKHWARSHFSSKSVWTKFIFQVNLYIPIWSLCLSLSELFYLYVNCIKCFLMVMYTQEEQFLMC